VERGKKEEKRKINETKGKTGQTMLNGNMDGEGSG
jgi:hypothetical protein